MGLVCHGELREHLSKVDAVIRGVERDEDKLTKKVAIMQAANGEHTKDTLERVGNVERELSRIRKEMNDGPPTLAQPPPFRRCNQP